MILVDQDVSKQLVDGFISRMPIQFLHENQVVSLHSEEEIELE